MPEFDTTKYNLPSDQANNSRLNSLRAAVLGANDGIVSTSSVVMGVAGATTDQHAIITAGLAALVAGALSMAVGEYVSVSSQSDAEKAVIHEEKKDLATIPDEELEELTQEYQKIGVSRPTAVRVAHELTAHNALKAHLNIHFGLNPDDINSPWQAAIASLASFTAGGLVPFIAVLLSPNEWRISITIAACAMALVITGYLSATAGRASRRRAIVRVLIGGILAMLVTYGIGHIFGIVAG